MRTTDIGAFEAKTRLSELLVEVEKGRRFRITRRGKPVAELRPIDEHRRRPTFGADRGRIAMRSDFDEPVDDFGDYR